MKTKTEKCPRCKTKMDAKYISRYYKKYVCKKCGYVRVREEDWK